jgi:uncharacterized membrane-anchored protein
MRSLPKINNVYWLSLIAASIFGTNTGDYLSDTLHLGHMVGIPYLLAAIAAIFAFEKLSPWASAVYFWAIIITVRTMATNIGDAFRDYGIGFNLSVPIVAALFAIAVAVYASTGRDMPNTGTVRVNPVYWVTMALAGILGTVAGDSMAFSTGIMPPGAAIVYGLALAAAFYWGRGGKLIQPVAYWATIALIRSFGTSVGDTLANNVFGLPPATSITGAVFIGMIAYFYGIRRDNEASTGLKAQHA